MDVAFAGCGLSLLVHVVFAWFSLTVLADVAISYI